MVELIPTLPVFVITIFGLNVPDPKVKNCKSASVNVLYADLLIALIAAYVLDTAEFVYSTPPVVSPEFTNEFDISIFAYGITEEPDCGRKTRIVGFPTVSLPTTSNFAPGVLVFTPTFPLSAMKSEEVPIAVLVPEKYGT